MEDARPLIESLLIESLRELGWPVEPIAVSDEDFFGLRLEIRLNFVPVPVAPTEEVPK